MTFDEKLKQALKESFEDRVEQNLVDTKKPRFSLAYRIWERKTLKNLYRPKKHLTVRMVRNSLVTAAACLGLLIGISAYALISVGRYSFETKPDHSKLFVENISSDKTRIEEYYGLPENGEWEILELYADDFGTLINYKHSEKKVSFKQELIQEYVGNVNTENAEINPISIFGENDGFIIDRGEKGCLMYWIYDGYLLSVSGNIDKNEAINLALSTKIVDYEKFS